MASTIIHSLPMKISGHIIFLVIMLSFAIRPGFLYSQAITRNSCQTDIATNSELKQTRQFSVKFNFPSIAAMVSEVNTDTIHKTLQQLQDWGSRFALKENRKEIAMWLKDKFLSYGFTDVKLDSFYCIANYYPYHDTTLQYNVICTLPGVSTSNELFVIGAHYDSYCTNDPYNNAPGADDNGSGTSATLEIARVMAKLNYHPQTTIQFTLFAAEELGKLGSIHAAQKERI